MPLLCRVPSLTSKVGHLFCCRLRTPRHTETLGGAAAAPRSPASQSRPGHGARGSDASAMGVLCLPGCFCSLWGLTRAGIAARGGRSTARPYCPLPPYRSAPPFPRHKSPEGSCPPRRPTQALACHPCGATVGIRATQSPAPLPAAEARATGNI